MSQRRNVVTRKDLRSRFGAHSFADRGRLRHEFFQFTMNRRANLERATCRRKRRSRLAAAAHAVAHAVRELPFARILREHRVDAGDVALTPQMSRFGRNAQSLAPSGRHAKQGGSLAPKNVTLDIVIPEPSMPAEQR